MNRRILCLGIASMVLAGAGLAAAENTGKEGKIRILLTSGGHGFEQDSFYAMFDAMQGIEYTKAELPKDAGLLKPGLEKQFDCIVMYDMCAPAISPEQRKAFVELLTTGGIGLVSMHHNLGAQWDWDEYRKIIGGRFILKPTEIDGKAWAVTPWAHDQRLKVKIADPKHPSTKAISRLKTRPMASYGSIHRPRSCSRPTTRRTIRKSRGRRPTARAVSFT